MKLDVDASDRRPRRSRPGPSVSVCIQNTARAQKQQRYLKYQKKQICTRTTTVGRIERVGLYQLPGIICLDAVICSSSRPDVFTKKIKILHRAGNYRGFSFILARPKSRRTMGFMIRIMEEDGTD
jgi:hypothetical protein